MSYPKWMDFWIESLNYEVDGGDFSKVIEMARDAWDILYNHGIDGGMPPEEFFSKYGDEPKSGIPYVSFDHPNDGARL